MSVARKNICCLELSRDLGSRFFFGCVENADCGLRGGSHIRKLNGTIEFYNFVTHYFEFISSTTLDVQVRVNAKVRAKAKVQMPI